MSHRLDHTHINCVMEVMKVIGIKIFLGLKCLTVLPIILYSSQCFELQRAKEKIFENHEMLDYSQKYHGLISSSSADCGCQYCSCQISLDVIFENNQRQTQYQVWRKMW